MNGGGQLVEDVLHPFFNHMGAGFGEAGGAVVRKGGAAIGQEGEVGAGAAANEFEDLLDLPQDARVAVCCPCAGGSGSWRYRIG
jgi:hypothetical protein